MHSFRDATRTHSEVPSGVQALAVGFLCLCFILIGALSVSGKSKTVDENSHYLYGRNILFNADATRFDDSKMPVTALNALPRKISRSFTQGQIRSFLQDFLAARLVTLLFSACIALVVFFWSRSLYGFIPALFSLGLYVLDPNIIAHSQLVTTDVYAMGATVLVFFFLWRFARQRTILYGLLCALSLGLGLIAKYSGVVLIPLALFALLIYDFPGMLKAYENHEFPTIARYFRNYGIYLLIVVIVSTAIINVSFLSDRTLTPLSGYQFQSGFFQSLQRIPVLGKLPVPLPYPYLEGFDLVLKNEYTGASYGNIYLLGQIRPGDEGFAGYYLIASLFKVPIASQLIYLLAIFFYIHDPQRRKTFFSDDVFLFVPVIFFALYYNFFFNAQIGIRYYLVVFPYLYIFSGYLFKDFNALPILKKTLALASMIYLAFSVFSYYPNFLAYFNEIVWDRLQAYRYLADSNIDWGQNSDELNEYLSAHPQAVYAPEKIQSGQIVVGVNQLTGIHGEPERYRWLWDNFQPVDSISYTYLIYQISPDEIAQLCNIREHCD
jgi:hypothetical protein